MPKVSPAFAKALEQRSAASVQYYKAKLEFAESQARAVAAGLKDGLINPGDLAGMYR